MIHSLHSLVPKIGLILGGISLLLVAGCFGVVATEGYSGPDYYGPGYFDDYGPDVTIFGGYDRGHRDRDAGRRGAESRGGMVHGGHSGGGEHGGGHGGAGHGGGGHR